MDQLLTVILPMHNRERQLRSSVMDILELATTIPDDLQIVVVDDGSTDETYEAACELARRYPQLTVLRQPMQMGLAAALEMVRARIEIDMAIVHDGVSKIDVAELQMLLQEEQSPQASARHRRPTTTSSLDTIGSRRFAAVRALHNQMEQVHRTVTSFRWIQLERPVVPRRRPSWPITMPLSSLGSMPSVVPLTTISGE